MHSLTNLLNELKIPYERMGKKIEDSFEHIKPYSQADDRSLIFINVYKEETLGLLLNGRYAIALLEKNAGIRHAREIENLNRPIFLVENPRLVVSRIMKIIYTNDDAYDRGIHPTAHINPEAVIHPTASIGPHCIIGKCEIGKNSRIDAFTVVKDNVIIGENVIIREYCHIGGCGFGFVKNQEGAQERFPHIGHVIIEDCVELFPYVNVDRGALGETRIKKGAKIDHYSHIGHNTTVGKNCIITAGTVMCGGSSIGDRSWSGVGSIIKEKVMVGNDVTVGLGAVVIKDVRSGSVVAGVPAKPLKRNSR